MTLEEAIELLSKQPPEKRKKIEEFIASATAEKRFVPNPGPQTLAWESQADELFYGGAAGGGKSALLCGTAIEQSQRSIIFRREYPQIKGLVDECTRILRTRDGYNAQDKIWRLPEGKELEFGSVPHEEDKEKYQGRAHDFIGFDEITHFLESQYRFLIGWNRAATPDQRCRVIAAGNPPISAEGAWVIKYWAPWLDPTHPNPAKQGELRWFTVIGGEDKEVDGPGPHMIDGEPRMARSRSFIAARLEDNYDLMKTGYASVLEGMPEPLRTMMREGRFDVAQRDAEFQVIPTAWIVAAQNRWVKDGYKNFAMTAMGFDPAGGGNDAAELCWRHGGWYAPIISERGESTADGSAAAATVFRHRRDNAPVVVDVGGGYGGAVSMRFRDNGIAHVSFNGANASSARTKDGSLKFANKRAEAWWRFREELDPDQEGGTSVALPPDPELRADLSAPTYEVSARGILIESKDQLRKRLGRSPGKGDAVVMCMSEGNAAVKRQLRNGGGFPKVNLGFFKQKRFYQR